MEKITKTEKNTTESILHS